VAPARSWTHAVVAAVVLVEVPLVVSLSSAVVGTMFYWLLLFSFSSFSSSSLSLPSVSVVSSFVADRSMLVCRRVGVDIDSVASVALVAPTCTCALIRLFSSFVCDLYH